MSTRSILSGKRFLLSACVSAAAIIAATPSRAADINWTKGAIADRGEFRAFVEGGVFWTGGDPVPFAGGFTPFINALTGVPTPFVAGSIPVARPRLGIDGAIGADYRFAG